MEKGTRCCHPSISPKSYAKRPLIQEISNVFEYFIFLFLLLHPLPPFLCFFRSSRALQAIVSGPDLTRTFPIFELGNRPCPRDFY